MTSRRAPSTERHVPARLSPPTTRRAPTSARAIPPMRVADVFSRPNPMAAASVNTGIVVMRMAATCTLVSDRPSRKSGALMTTARIANPATRRLSSRESAGSPRTSIARISDAPAIRSHANTIGENCRIPSFETM